ncbi:hypothetical protein E3E12_02410 [Formicincola oecophyllae]|uniref:Uncharacterized protein n=1 Tax=Formicincola oecophyllae TaxID=2558361 RepID=A0A4Y6U779_9PROT|nr:hypothetical protein [Formicincola oecophyllae]QDH13243.2 hypothetical protein E3E12_02410 [Formicincola oecophyllae]
MKMVFKFPEDLMRALKEGEIEVDDVITATLTPVLDQLRPPRYRRQLYYARAATWGWPLPQDAEVTALGEFPFNDFGEEEPPEEQDD